MPFLVFLIYIFCLVPLSSCASLVFHHGAMAGIASSPFNAEAVGNHLDDAAPAHLLCPVCFEPPPGRVEQCSAGHIICAHQKSNDVGGVGATKTLEQQSCLSKLRARAAAVGRIATCPECRVPLPASLSRCLVAERCVALLPATNQAGVYTPCRHCNQVTTYTTTRGGLAAHEAVCLSKLLSEEARERSAAKESRAVAAAEFKAMAQLAWDQGKASREEAERRAEGAEVAAREANATVFSNGFSVARAAPGVPPAARGAKTKLAQAWDEQVEAERSKGEVRWIPPQALTEEQLEVFDELYDVVNDPWPSVDNVTKLSLLMFARDEDTRAHIQMINARNRTNA